VLLEGITDAIAAPVTARRRRIGTVAGTKLGVLLLSVVALAVAAGNILLAGGKALCVIGLGRWRLGTLTEWRGTIRRGLCAIGGRGPFERRSTLRRGAAWRHFAGLARGILGTRSDTCWQRRGATRDVCCRVLTTGRGLACTRLAGSFRLRATSQEHQWKKRNQDATGHGDLQYRCVPTPRIPWSAGRKRQFHGVAGV
jgi:hypothetical protein